MVMFLPDVSAHAIYNCPKMSIFIGPLFDAFRQYSLRFNYILNAAKINLGVGSLPRKYDFCLIAPEMAFVSFRGF